MRRIAIAFALTLAACGQQEQAPEAPAEETVVVRVPPPWFICDSINQPAIIVFDRTGADVRTAEYDKPNGAIVQRIGYFVGEEEGAAGSVMTELWQHAAVSTTRRADSRTLVRRQPDHAALLDAMAGLLARVALCQTVPEAAADETYPIELLRELAAQLSPEDTHLYYQIATLGRRDIVWAPDARTGFEMTLLRMLAGFETPTEGRILIDGVELTDANRSAWQRQIAHVPQSIYLADASLAENIAFGVPPAEIDRARVAQAANRAELAEVIAALPDGYDTLVGERGVRLSGCQRQRVGIARALYKEASVLVFDEATSALDTETEAAVMRAIDGLTRDLTILIIAHRMSTVEGCDEVVRLNGASAGRTST